MACAITRTALLLFALSLSVPSEAAWRQQDGQGIFIQSVMEQTADDGFDIDGEAYPIATYTARRLQSYVAYGIPEWPVTVGGKFTLTAAKQYNFDTDAIDNTMAIEDPEFFARTILWNDETRSIALEPFFKAPSQTSDDNQRLAGNVHTDFGARLYYGEKFQLFGLEHYSQSMAGYRKRLGPFANQWEYEQTLGINLSHDYHLLLQGFGTQSTATLQTGNLALNNAGDYDVIKSQISLLIPVEENVHLQLGYLWDIDGKTIVKSRMWTVGLWQNF